MFRLLFFPDPQTIRRDGIEIAVPGDGAEALILGGILSDQWIVILPSAFESMGVGIRHAAPENPNAPAPPDRILGLPSRRTSGQIMLGLLLVLPFLLVQLVTLVPLPDVPLCSVRDTSGCFPWGMAGLAMEGWLHLSPAHFLDARIAMLAFAVLMSLCAIGLVPGRRPASRAALAMTAVWLLLSFA